MIPLRNFMPLAPWEGPPIPRFLVAGLTTYVTEYVPRGSNVGEPVRTVTNVPLPTPAPFISPPPVKEPVEVPEREPVLVPVRRQAVRR